LTLPDGFAAFLLVLLTLAQTGTPGEREVKARRVELSRGTSGAVPEVRAAPGYLTVLEFDSPLDCAGLTVEERESRFALLECNTRTVVLRLAVELAAGERLLLTVSFTDERLPARAVLALVGHPAEVDGQVQVARQPLSNKELQAQLEATLARCGAGGLTAVLLSGAVDEHGVTVERFLGGIHWNGVEEAPRFAPRIYRSSKLVVAVVHIRLPSGGPPWIPGEARLLDAKGSVVSSMPIRMDAERLEPGQVRVIAVEVERRREDLGERFSLEVREKGGERGVLIERVEF
jgi:uncharacterized protein (TIGR02268 family)